MKYDKKLTQLGAKLFGERAANPERCILALEHELELRIPEEYRALVLDYGGAILFEKSTSYRPLQPSPFADDIGCQDIEMLYGPGDCEFGLSRVNRWLCNQIPPHVLAIGDAGFGDQICLGTMKRCQEPN